ncbi:MAG: hypothetical protein ACREO3_08135 [Arenimonas sp.]
MDLTKQPGAQPGGTETALPDTFQAFEDFVDRWYGANGVDAPKPSARGPRKAPAMPDVLRAPTSRSR